MNSLNVTVEIPRLFDAIVDSLTVNKIGSISTVAAAPPPPDIFTVRVWFGKKFLPLLITSIEVIVPAALTFAENSGSIGSGPKGFWLNVTIGGAPAL